MNIFQAKDKKVSVMVQINTSGEENKNGLEPSEGMGLSFFCPIQKNSIIHFFWGGGRIWFILKTRHIYKKCLKPDNF